MEVRFVHPAWGVWFLVLSQHTTNLVSFLLGSRVIILDFFSFTFFDIFFWQVKTSLLASVSSCTK